MPAVKIVEQLLTAFEGPSANLIRVTSNRVELEEALQVVSRKDMIKLSTVMLQRAQETIADESCWNADGDEEAVGVSVLRSVTFILSTFAKDDKAPHQQMLPLAEVLHGTLRTPSDLFNAVGILINLAVDFGSKTAALQNEISQLCEQWWIKERPSRDDLAAQTVAYLLIKAVHPKAKANDVKRAYHLREAFSLFDWRDPDSANLREMLPKCMISGPILREAEGRRLLSSFFSLDVALIDELFNAIKGQLPYNRQSIQDAYGEILYRAWRSATGQFLLAIEERCIQDLMYSACHCVDAKTARCALRVLHEFHNQKRNKGVDEMLVRLYEPILWRSLTTANPLVRRNAAVVFYDAFPLNCDGNREENDHFLQKQIGVLRELLEDKTPMVRKIAAEGTGRVLALYWEALPATVAQALCTRVAHLALDASNKPVRAGALSGLESVLDCHLSQPLLKSLLPHLQPLLLDTSQIVREAMAQLLLRVKNVRAIKFIDVCPMDMILERLAHDKSENVKKYLAELLLKTYLPDTESLDNQVSRAVKLCKTEPGAAGPFFFNATHHGHVAASTAGRLAAALIGIAAVGEQGLNENEDVLLAVLQSAASLLEGAGEAVFESEKIASIVSDRALSDIAAKLTSGHMRSALIRVAASLPAKMIPSFSKHALENLISACATGQREEAGAYVQALVNWGKSKKLATVLLEALEASNLTKTADAEIKEKEKETGKKKRGASKKKDDFSVHVEGATLSCDAALQILGFIMEKEKLRMAVCADDATTDALILRLEGVKPALLMYIDSLSKKGRNVSQPVGLRLTAGLVLLFRMALFAQRDSVIQSLLQWASTAVAPSLSELHREAAKPFVEQLGSVVLALASETMALGLADGVNTAKAISIAQTLLSAASSAAAASAHTAKMLLHASTRGGSSYASTLLNTLAETAVDSAISSNALRVVLESLKSVEPESLSAMLEIAAGNLSKAVSAQSEIVEGDDVSPLLAALVKLAEQTPVAKMALIRALSQEDEDNESAQNVLQALNKLMTVT